MEDNNMSKIVVLKGSPRKNGNSNTMAAAFVEEARRLGIDVTEYDAANLKIEGCRAYGACAGTGKCVFHDDFERVAADIISADGIVIASPVYWYSFPAKLKALIDRFFGIYMGGKNFSGKKTALLCCCEDETPESFKGICFAFEKSMELMGAELAGEVLIHSVNEIGDIKHTDGEAQARALAAKFV